MNIERRQMIQEIIDLQAKRGWNPGPDFNEHYSTYSYQELQDEKQRLERELAETGSYTQYNKENK